MSGGVKNFLQFVKTDPQLKAFGHCTHHVDLLALDSINRTALVVVKHVILTKLAHKTYMQVQRSQTQRSQTQRSQTQRSQTQQRQFSAHHTQYNNLVHSILEHDN